MTNDILHYVIDYILRVGFYTLVQFLLVFGPAFLFAFATQILSDKIRTLGWTKFGEFYTYATAPGVVCHECGHALFGLIFGKKIVEFVPFRPQNGCLGYVTWERDREPNSLTARLGNFFSGTGPIWLGSAVIALLAFYFLGEERMDALGLTTAQEQRFNSFEEVVQYIINVFYSGLGIFFRLFSPETLTNPLTLIGLYLIFCIGGHIELSPPDLRFTKHGFSAIIGVLLIFNAATAWLGEFPMDLIYALTQYNHVLYAFLVFVLVTLLVLWLIMIVISSSRRN